MSKTRKYAITGATILGIGNAILDAVMQHEEMEKNPEQKFDWGRFLVAGGKGALLGVAGGALIGGIADYENSKEKPVNTDAYLLALASKLRLKKTDGKYLLLCEKADILISLLKKEYAYELKGEPMRLGSTEKGTALRNKFDIDVCFSFKARSFGSTREMFETVFEFLEKQIGRYSIIDVRDQKKSVGVIFNIKGEKHKIDVVPYKLTGGNKNGRSGYLYLNDKSFFSDNSSYTKTDIHALKNIRLTETQKRIVIVLKHWRKTKDLSFSSHLLENLVLDAYQYNRFQVPRKFTDKVIMVLSHIANNLDVAVIRSVENTNNILTDISEQSKREIIDACQKTIDEYEYQPNSIMDIFKHSR